MDVETLVRPVVEGAGLELYEVVFRGESGRQILRVTVDRAGGVDLDTLGTVSEKLSRRLDLEDFGRGRYELEVSTPGIERPLKAPAHFRLASQALGREITWQKTPEAELPVAKSA